MSFFPSSPSTSRRAIFADQLSPLFRRPPSPPYYWAPSLSRRMESKEDRLVSDAREKVSYLFKDFLTGIAKIDRLTDEGSRFVVGFRQALDFLRRPPIDMTNKLVGKIIAINETKRVKSYLETGCRNTHDTIRNMENLHLFKSELLKHLSEVKEILKELDGFLDDVTNSVRSTFEGSSVMNADDELSEQPNSSDKGMASPCFQDFNVTDLAILMASIYSMVKQEYAMQEKICSALNLKSSSEELESYCLMWSLRPFIDDEVMHIAWKLIP